MGKEGDVVKGDGVKGDAAKGDAARSGAVKGAEARPPVERVRRDELERLAEADPGPRPP